MCEAEHVELSVQAGREMTLLMRRVLRLALASSGPSSIPPEIQKIVPLFFLGRLKYVPNECTNTHMAGATDGA